MRVVGDEHMAAALAKAPSLIPVYWHQHQLFCGKYLLEQAPRGFKLGLLISPSVDGEIGVMVVSRFGGHVIRGSSTTHRRPRAARLLRRAGEEGHLSLDHARWTQGAALRVQAGRDPAVADVAAARSCRMAYAASRAWLIEWDKFVIPWPFSRIVIAVGAPRQVPRAIAARGARDAAA